MSHLAKLSARDVVFGERWSDASGDPARPPARIDMHADRGPRVRHRHATPSNRRCRSQLSARTTGAAGRASLLMVPAAPKSP